MRKNGPVLAFVLVVLVVADARADDAPTTVVHLEGANGHVVLERVSDGVPFCAGRCRHAVPSGQYRIAGDDVRPSAPFTVDGAHAFYEVGVARITSRPQRVGVGLLAGGAGALVLGAIFLGITFATMNETCGSILCVPLPDMMGALAGIFGAAGLVLVVTGGAMTAQSAPSQEPTSVRRIAGMAFVKTF